MLSDAAARRTCFVIASDPMSVRHAVQVVFARLKRWRINPDACDSTQIVLAEALNNIVKHAYAQAPGEIEVMIDLSDSDLTCRIMDAGLPLPGCSVLPAWVAPVPDGGEVPEGGYGWHLIRTLTKDVSYRRAGGRNILTFRIASQQGPQ
ncbi:ATP-binding protein [Pseudotabrizicola formosa]|uniref:ATP-binding protein n=1 Tax=Pseudotabrizicola formosa TaxID=2030009 RepID=UPI000CD1118C|nr:ATP-binding protein [Pseudotabrizicola formosa]